MVGKVPNLGNFYPLGISEVIKTAKKYEIGYK